MAIQSQFGKYNKAMRTQKGKDFRGPTREESYIILERCFKENPYPKQVDYLLLQAVTGMDKGEIKKCFGHLRLKYKKKGTIKYKLYRQLETYYDIKQNPSREEMKEIAKHLRLKESQVRNFFAKKWHTRLQSESNIQNIESGKEECTYSVIHV